MTPSRGFCRTHQEKHFHEGRHVELFGNREPCLVRQQHPLSPRIKVEETRPKAEKVLPVPQAFNQEKMALRFKHTTELLEKAQTCLGRAEFVGREDHEYRIARAVLEGQPAKVRMGRG